MQKLDEDDIEVLSNIEGIRKRPSMYIGSTDSDGIFHLVKEILDNAVDEYLAGRNKSIGFIKDGKNFWIYDYGKGIPTGIHKKTGISTLTTIFTHSHAGGKFGSKAYGNAVGVNGVGSTCVVALSKQFEVWTKFTSKWETQKFLQGIQTNTVKTCRPPKLPLDIKPKPCGTIICFEPDQKIFGKITKSKTKEIIEGVYEWCEITAYLNPKLTIRFDNLDDGTSKEWFFEDGIKEYLQARRKHLSIRNSSVEGYFVADKKDFCLGMEFLNQYQTFDFRSFVNSSNTMNGGNHALAFWKAYHDALYEYSKRDHQFDKIDLYPTIVGVLNFKVQEPVFSSQTKQNLSDKRGKDIEDQIYEILVIFFRKNKDLTTLLLDSATACYKDRTNDKHTKSLSKRLNEQSRSKTLLPGKLVQAPHCKPEQRSLYIVEGQSACFVGQTEVWTTKGPKTFIQLVKDWEVGIKYIGKSFNLVTKNFELQPLENPRISKYTDQLVSVISGSGNCEICTMDHKWLLENGDYKIAINLKRRDVLRSVQKQTVSGVHMYMTSPVYVYDLTCRKNSNFVLEGGYVVHNSGPATQARTDVHTQEILALKGKPLNAAKCTRERLYDSQEIFSVLLALGFNPNANDPYKNLRVQDKIVLLADGDADGSHINLLLLTMIAVVLPRLFDMGLVYIASTPEFMVQYKDKRYYGKSLQQIKKQIPESIYSNIKHIKGWGESPPIVLREVAFDLDTAILQKAKKPSEKMRRKFLSLMSDDIEARRQLLGI